MRTYVLVACAALCLFPGPIQAQPTGAVMLDDPDPPGWDVSGHMSWLAVDKTGVAPGWNRWYDVATVGASVGRFFGSHARAEFDVATSASADVYMQRQVVVPGQPLPIFISQPQRFRMTTVSAGGAYQFFDNRWFHPFVGAGLEASRETRTVEQVFYPVSPPASVSGDPPGTTHRWRARPYANVGFKWFVSERAFIRSDVRTTLGRGGLTQVSWRTGLGVDF